MRSGDVSHHIVEDEAAVRELEVLEEAVELTAVQRAPWTVQVISGLRLLPCVVVVEELDNKRMNTTHNDHSVAHGQSEIVTEGLMNSSALMLISYSTEIYSGKTESRKHPAL